MNFVIFFLFCLFSNLGYSHVTDQSPAHALPRGTTFSLKLDRDLNLEPNKSEHLVLAWNDDEDGDGVPDYIDFCPKTPKGTPVWQHEDVVAGKVKSIFEGCGGLPGETPLTVGKNGPKGWRYHMVLRSESPDDRLLEKDAIFTIVSGKLKVDNKPFRGPAMSILSLLKAAITQR